MGSPTQNKVRPEHPVLRTRGILHFVDQYVAYLVIQEQRDIPGTFSRAKRVVGGQGYFDEVRLVVCAKQLLQLRYGHWQQA
jgi:hypothetical protein